MMPCVYDDVPGSWGSQSEGWPHIEDTDGSVRRLVIREKLVPYGSYVTVGNHLRLETNDYVERVRIAMRSNAPQAAPQPVKGDTREVIHCPACDAPCKATVHGRGGDWGWGTTDEERTTYKYEGYTTAQTAPQPVEAEGRKFPASIVTIHDPYDEEARIVGFRIRPGDPWYGTHGLSEPLEALRKAINTPPDQTVEAEGREANGNLVGWWNGILPDKTERSPYGPSVRWGADAENSGHDIPLYDGYNPVHYQTPPEQPAIDPESANFKEGMAVGMSQYHELVALMKGPVCQECGAGSDAEAATMCKGSGDGCPGTEFPLALLWEKQPAIDLEQFRPAVELYRLHMWLRANEGMSDSDSWRRKEHEADRLLAIIDGAKAGRAKGEEG